MKEQRSDYSVEARHFKTGRLSGHPRTRLLYQVYEYLLTLYNRVILENKCPVLCIFVKVHLNVKKIQVQHITSGN